MNRGFTFVEALVYIALLALMIGGGIVAAFSIIDSSEKEKTKINAIADAEFLMRKIDWALNGVNAINSPAAGASGETLSVNKSGFPSNPIVIDLDLLSSRAKISRGGGPAVFLTGDRVKIEGLSFEHIADAPPKPAAIKASFTANGKIFQMKKYLRK